jgi:DNA-binding transcriptional LysR family regulator
MDIHQLRVFTSVFKNKSFSKASEELHLTQPTISNHIKALEDEFECKLFDRLGRTILPTKEAEVLYSHSLEVIEKAAVLKEAVGEMKKDLTGKLVIGASSIPGVYLMPRIMTEFQKKYPSISFQIIISDSRGIIDSISRHEVLLGIVGAKIGNEQIHYVPFIEDELIVHIFALSGRKSQMTLKELVRTADGTPGGGFEGRRKPRDFRKKGFLEASRSRAFRFNRGKTGGESRTGSRHSVKIFRRR